MSPRRKASSRNRRHATLFAVLFFFVGIPAGLGPVSGSRAWAGPNSSQLSPTQLQHLHFRRAETLYRELRFREALAEYKKALEAKHHPAIVFNIAQCYRQLGEWKKAMLSYKLFLSERPNAPNRAEVEQWIRLAKQKIAEEKAKNSRGKVSVITRPAGAAIRVDQPTAKPLAVSPATITLSVGPHVLFFTKPGYDSAQRVVTVTPRSIAAVSLSLTKLATGPAMGKVSLITRPAGAKIFVDKASGKPSGRSPAILRLPAGDHVLLFTMKGHQPVQTVVTVKPKTVVTKTVTLPAARSPLRSLALTSARKTTAHKTASKAVPTHPNKNTYVPYKKRGWFKAGVSLASIFAVLGIVSGSLALWRYKTSWESNSGGTHDLTTIKNLGDQNPRYAEDAKGIRILAGLADGLFAASIVTGLATTIGAIVVWKRQKRQERQRRSLMMTPSCSRNGCGLMVHGSF